MADKLIITSALTGAITIPTQTPHLPFTPEHLIADAIACSRAGASAVHVAEEEGDLGVSHGDAVEISIVRGHQVEEVLVAVPVEDHLAVACGFDHDGSLRSAALGEIIGAVERRAIGCNLGIESAVILAVVLVEARMNEDPHIG